MNERYEPDVDVSLRLKAPTEPLEVPIRFKDVGPASRTQPAEPAYDGGTRPVGNSSATTNEGVSPWMVLTLMIFLAILIVLLAVNVVQRNPEWFSAASPPAVQQPVAPAYVSPLTQPRVVEVPPAPPPVVRPQSQVTVVSANVPVCDSNPVKRAYCDACIANNAPIYTAAEWNAQNPNGKGEKLAQGQLRCYKPPSGKPRSR